MASPQDLACIGQNIFDQRFFGIQNSFDRLQARFAGHKFQLANAEGIDLAANKAQFFGGRRGGDRQRIGDKELAAGLPANFFQLDTGMNADQPEFAKDVIEFKNSEIGDQPHGSGLETGPAPFVVGQNAARGGTELNGFDEALGRMARQVQREIFVQVGHVGHAALARQAQPFAFAFDPGVVGAAPQIDLRGGDDLVGDASGLVIPVVGVVAAPESFGGLPVERLGKGEGHGMRFDANESTIQGNKNEAGGGSALGE